MELLSSVAGKHSNAGDGEHEKNLGLVASITGHSWDAGDSSDVLLGHTKLALPPEVAGKLKYP